MPPQSDFSYLLNPLRPPACLDGAMDAALRTDSTAWGSPGDVCQREVGIESLRRKHTGKVAPAQAPG